VELIEKVLSNQNLYEAYLQVYRNKGASGIDGVTVDELGEYLYENKEEIKKQILNRKYKPQPVRRVEIPKENGKMRLLGIPTVVDRVLQQALVQVLSPIYELQFSNSSYGFRSLRSCEMAVTRSLELMNDGNDYIVDIDLERFFDTVNQDKLISIIRRTIKDGEVVSLIRKFLQSGVMVNGVEQATLTGTPQGGNLSPLLSNIMLNELDKELEARGLNFTRYADDCLIYLKSQKAAERVMETITKFIEKKLGLIVNVSKSKISRPKGIKYLGFGFYNKNGTWRPKPHLKSVEKLIQKLKKLLCRSWSISLDHRLLKLKQLIYGWVNYFKIADMKKLMETLDENIRRKIRVVIWKQWKKMTRKYKNLRKLGITHELAYMTATTSKGNYVVGNTRCLKIAINNKRLNKRGLVSLLDRYNKVHI